MSNGLEYKLELFRQIVYVFLYELLLAINTYLTSNKKNIEFVVFKTFVETMA